MNTKKKKSAEFDFDPITRKPDGALPDFNLHLTTLLPHPAFDTVQFLQTLSDVKALPATYLPTSQQRIQYFSGNNNITAQRRNSEAYLPWITAFISALLHLQSQNSCQRRTELRKGL